MCYYYIIMLSPSCPMHQKGTSFSLQNGYMRHALSSPLMTKCIGTNIPTLKRWLRLPPPCKAELMPALVCVSFVRRFIVLFIILLSIHSIYLRVLSSVVPCLPERESFSHSCRCAAVCSVPQPSRFHHPSWLAISDNTHLLVQTASSAGVSTYWLYLLS